MKKLFVYLSLLFLVAIPQVRAQKLVIGSQAPSFKGIEWKNLSPQTDRTMLIEFYHSGNSSSQKLFEKLEGIHTSHAEDIQIIVLTRDKDESIDFLKSVCGDKYIVGYDPTGEVFKSFGVKYLPFTMLFDAKGKLCWIGNLGALEESDLKEAL